MPGLDATPKSQGLLSLEQGHPSMGKMPLGKQDPGNRGGSLLLERSCEFRNLLHREGVKEALGKDNGFTQARIDVVVR